MVDQLFFDPNSMGKRISDQTCREDRIRLEHLDGGVSFQPHNEAFRQGRGSGRAPLLARQTSGAEEVAGFRYFNGCFFAGFGDNRQLDFASFEVEDCASWIALREDHNSLA